jgi:hypothetical protein
MEFWGYEHMRGFHTLAFFCDIDVVMSWLLVQGQMCRRPRLPTAIVFLILGFAWPKLAFPFFSTGMFKKFEEVVLYSA